MNTSLKQQLTQLLGEGSILCDEPMSRHTTFRTGGTADFIVSPSDADQLRECMRICEKENVPFSIIGNGSNLLVGDKGYRGVIIRICRCMDQIKVMDNTIRAGAGAMMVTVARAAMEHSLTGLEFASGIPGTLGGAVVMNAGAYGGEIKDVCTRVAAMSMDGQIRVFSGAQMEFGYRTSLVQKQKMIVLEADLVLKEGDRSQIVALMDDLRDRRNAKQPLELPSAGSTFKRPEGNFAGKLIQEAGLAGYTIGGAQVSPKHCGFVVNIGDATSADIRKLIDEVKERVFESSGVMLEPEVKMLGEF